MDYDTKDIEQAFEGVGSRFDTLEGDFNKLRQNQDNLTLEVSKAKRMLGTGGRFDNNYQGIWPTEEHAKAFGAVVLAACGRTEFYKQIVDSPYGAFSKDPMSTYDPAGGGNLIPVELARYLIDLLGQYGKFRRNVTVFPMGSGSANVPKITSDLTIYAPGEGQEIPKSKVQAALVKLLPKKLACLTAVNRELEEDSLIAVGEIVGKSIVRSMAKAEDSIGFLGDGTEEFFGMTGILGALRGVDSDVANIAGIQVGTGSGWGGLVLGDFERLAGLLPDDMDENARWFCHKRFYYEVMHKLAQDAGVANLMDILSDRRSRSFMGYPVEFVHAMPKESGNDQLCCILGDLSMGVYMGERRSISIERSDDVYFASDQVAIRGTERIDVNAFGVGDTNNPGPITAMMTGSG